LQGKARFLIKSAEKVQENLWFPLLKAGKVATALYQQNLLSPLLLGLAPPNLKRGAEVLHLILVTAHIFSDDHDRPSCKALPILAQTKPNFLHRRSSITPETPGISAPKCSVIPGHTARQCLKSTKSAQTERASLVRGACDEDQEVDHPKMSPSHLKTRRVSPSREKACKKTQAIKFPRFF